MGHEMMENECEWHLGPENKFMLHHIPTGTVLWFKSWVMKIIALGLMANLLNKNFN
jgi:hypothetical protein